MDTFYKQYFYKHGQFNEHKTYLKDILKILKHLLAIVRLSLYLKYNINMMLLKEDKYLKSLDASHAFLKSSFKINRQINIVNNEPETRDPLVTSAIVAKL